MKKLLVLLLAVFGIITLSGCNGDDVYIEDGIITVRYENLRYEDTSVFATIFVTNGLESDEFVGYAEFDVCTSDDVFCVAGAGFDLDVTVLAGSYAEFEIEFGPEFVFLSLDDIATEGYSIDDLELVFWIE